MKDHGGQQEADALGPSVDCSRQSSGLSGQVEAQVQAKQVLVHTACDPSYGLLCNAGEDGIAQLLGDGCAHAGEAIWCTSQSWLGGNGIDCCSLQAMTMDPATVHAVPPTATKSIFMESTMFLK
jgi:hypothetical protein